MYYTYTWEPTQTLMKYRGIMKIPRYRWIKVDKRIHAFILGDKTHPKIHENYKKITKTIE